MYTRLDLKPTDIDCAPFGSKWMQNLKHFFRPFFVSVHRSGFKILEAADKYYMAVHLVLLELAGPETSIDLKMTPKICKF